MLPVTPVAAHSPFIILLDNDLERPDPARSIPHHRLVVGFGIPVGLTMSKNTVDHTKQFVRGGNDGVSAANLKRRSPDSDRFVRRRAHKDFAQYRVAIAAPAAFPGASAGQTPDQAAQR